MMPTLLLRDVDTSYWLYNDRGEGFRTSVMTSQSRAATRGLSCSTGSLVITQGRDAALDHVTD